MGSISVSSEVPPARPLTRFDRRLAKILEHATSIFCEKGYEGASMRDLSRASGMSLAGLYYYFESKEKLLYLIQKDLFTTVMELLRERLKEVAEPEARVRMFILNHVEYFLANQKAMKVLSHEAESLAGDLHKLVATKKERYARVARKILREIAEQERTNVGVDLTVATYALFGMMNWIYNWYDPRGKLSVNQLVDNITRLFVGGFLSTAAEFAFSEPAKAERLSIWRSA